jgi:3-methyladenine DNA glycosylase AlkC
MTEKVLLKDILFNRTKVEQIAGEIQSVYPSFKKNEFVDDVVNKFPALELKARISWIAECLKKYLPGDFKRASGILIKSLPASNNPELSDGDFGDFIYAPYSEYIAKYGCTKEHLKISLEALYEITQRFSAEDAIRYFINAYPKETLKELLLWTKDPHYHVRRLCSEGTRPKLPWSQKINIRVTASIPILNNLFSDKTRFVIRSVANHINDISKTDPDLALETIIGWQQLNRQKPSEMEYIFRHALRTLVKKGNSNALKLLGFQNDARVNLSKFRVPKQVKMNTALEFSFTIQAQKDINIIIDYILHFQNKAGKLSSKKVFKLTSLTLKKEKPVRISKIHMLKERMTTRTLYPGKHEIEIQINGRRLAKGSFLLSPSPKTLLLN